MIARRAYGFHSHGALISMLFLCCGGIELAPFVKLARTIRKHAVGILAYLDTKMTNGLVEGINNKLRVIARRAYGFHSHGALISSMLFLCCGGIDAWVDVKRALTDACERLELARSYGGMRTVQETSGLSDTFSAAEEAGYES